MSQSLIVKLQKLERQVSRKTPFSFFALFQREDSEKWDLLLAAPWLAPHEMKSQEKVTSIVAKALNKSEFSQLIRILILENNKQLLKDIKEINPLGNPLPLQLNHFTFSGVDIARGFVFAAPANSLRKLQSVT
jgi:hypothetical protein